MKMLKRIILLPVFILVAIMSTIVKLIVKAECWVAGVGFLLLSICAILALANRMWLQLGIFGLISAAGALILLFSVHIEVWLDCILDGLWIS